MPEEEKMRPGKLAPDQGADVNIRLVREMSSVLLNDMEKLKSRAQSINLNMHVVLSIAKHMRALAAAGREESPQAAEAALKVAQAGAFVNETVRLLEESAQKVSNLAAKALSFADHAEDLRRKSD